MELKSEDDIYCGIDGALLALSILIYLFLVCVLYNFIYYYYERKKRKEIFAEIEEEEVVHKVPVRLEK